MQYEPLKFQEKIIKKVKNKNALVCAPTNSGKTIVAYHWSNVFNTLNEYNFRKIIFTSPIKALSNERYLKLKESGIEVGLVTGDVKWNLDARVLCMTQEIYSQGYYLQPCDIIIDEFHYIFQNSDRARCYIESIDKSHKDTKMLLMSATCKEPEKLNKYLKYLTNKKIIVSDSNERLVPLKYDLNGISIKNIQEAIVFAFSIKDIFEIIRLFISNRKEINKRKIDEINELAIKNKINYQSSWNYGISPYHGKMLPKEKRFIELLFSTGYIDVVVGTDALSLGVNFPAKTVVITTLCRPTGEMLKTSEFFQLIGRAGRYGFHDIGIATFLKDSPFDYNKDLKNNFKKYINNKLEDVKIKTEVDIKALFNGRFDDEEVDLLYRYRYPISDVPEFKIKRELFKEVKIINDSIKAISNSIYENSNNIIQNYWKNIITTCYLQEWDLNLNSDYSFYSALELKEKNKLNIFSLLENNLLYNDQDAEGVKLQKLLFILKYVKNLEKNNYFIENINSLKDKINIIDQTVFNPEFFITF